MKIATFSGLVMMFMFTTADANHHGDHRGHPNLGGEEAFELILSYTDETTAAEIAALRDDITATREELKALGDTGDEESITALREQLKSMRSALREQVKGVVQANDELKSELRTMAQETRQDRLVGAFAIRSDEGFAEIIAAADADQAAALTDTQGQLDALKAELMAARDSGATRDDVKDIAAQVRALRLEQRETIAAVLDANAELRDDLLEQARAARQELRDEFRDNRQRRRRQTGG